MPRRTPGSHGRPGLHKPGLTTNPASTRAPRLALRFHTEGPGLQGPTTGKGGPRWLHRSRHGKPTPSRLGRAWGASRRDAVPAAPCALPRAGSDAAGGVAGDGAYRNVLPHLGARSRHAAPSRVPSGSLVSRAAEAGGPLGMSRGPSAPLLTHFSARSSPTRGSCWSFRRSLIDPGVRWLRWKRWSAQATRVMATGASLAHLSQAE